MYVKGMIVKINDEGFEKYGENEANPVGLLGVVVGATPNDTGWYDVEWPNGENNAYEVGTLDVVEG